MAATCRFCGKELEHVFVDLGTSPLSNSYIPMDKANHGEVFYPLKAHICQECFLVQLEEYQSPAGIFSDYAYLSSCSASWLAHAKQYTEDIVAEYKLDVHSQVVELASNDGYLLQYFKEKNIPAFGIEPAANVAKIAQQKGIETLVEFFGANLAHRLSKQGTQADLIIANNVLAHVPDLNDFVEGIRILLSENGIVTAEFPYLLNLMDENQFDTIYHEHFSYFSFFTINKVFAAHGMRIFDVKHLKTHGGSLRIYACHQNSNRSEKASVQELLTKEQQRGANRLNFYLDFHEQVEKTKRQVLSFLIKAKSEGKKVCGYGAPAKGNTLLNYCGIRSDMIDFTVDKNPLKQNTLLPGSRIPVYAPDKIVEFKPDYLVILPWNIRDEIMQQEARIRDWGGQFVVFIPEVKVL